MPAANLEKLWLGKVQDDNSNKFRQSDATNNL